MQLTHTPPPRYFPRISMDILFSATSWSYLQDVAWPLQLHFSQWKPLPAVPGFHGIWLYMGQHFSHLSPHVWRSHSHSWCWGITLIRYREISIFLSYAYLLNRTRDLWQIHCRYTAEDVCLLRSIISLRNCSHSWRNVCGSSLIAKSVRIYVIVLFPCFVQF